MIRFMTRFSNYFQLSFDRMWSACGINFQCEENLIESFARFDELLEADKDSTVEHRNILCRGEGLSIVILDDIVSRIKVSRLKDYFVSCKN